MPIAVLVQFGLYMDVTGSPEVRSGPLLCPDPQHRDYIQLG